ncbi:MAG: TetR/AcrR family transcriptional regulator [Patescibacteria group bacterium]
MRPYRRKDAKAWTRRRVLACARALFAEKGFERTTIRGIAKSAGMSTGAVFANFDGKEALCLAVIANDLNLRFEKLQAAAETPGTVWEIVSAISSADYAYQLGQLSFTPLLFESRWIKPSQLSISSWLRADRIRIGVLILEALTQGVRNHEICETQLTPLTADTLWAVHIDNYRLAMLDSYDLAKLDKRFSYQAHKILQPG